jgi:hypothetical protein
MRTLVLVALASAVGIGVSVAPAFAKEADLPCGNKRCAPLIYGFCGFELDSECAFHVAECHSGSCKLM